MKDRDDAIRPPTDDLRVARYAPGWGYAAREWSRALENLDWPGAELLKSHERGSVWLTPLTIGGRVHRTVLKVEALRSLRKRVQSILGRSKLHRQWRGAALLARAGVPAAPPLAMLRGASGRRSCEVLVLDAIPGDTLLALLARDPVPEERAGACAGIVAGHLRRMARAGLANRDPKPSNIIVGSGNDGRPVVTFVDTEGVQRRRTALDELAGRFLASLELEVVGVGAEPPRTFAGLIARAVGAAGTADPAEIESRSRGIMDRARQIVAGHADPTPKHDPLRRP